MEVLFAGNDITEVDEIALLVSLLELLELLSGFDVESFLCGTVGVIGAGVWQLATILIMCQAWQTALTVPDSYAVLMCSRPCWLITNVLIRRAGVIEYLDSPGTSTADMAMVQFHASDRTTRKRDMTRFLEELDAEATRLRSNLKHDPIYGPSSTVASTLFKSPFQNANYYAKAGKTRKSRSLRREEQGVSEAQVVLPSKKRQRVSEIAQEANGGLTPPQSDDGGPTTTIGVVQTVAARENVIKPKKTKQRQSSSTALATGDEIAEAARKATRKRKSDPADGDTASVAEGKKKRREKRARRDARRERDAAKVQQSAVLVEEPVAVIPDLVEDIIEAQELAAEVGRVDEIEQLVSEAVQHVTQEPEVAHETGSIQNEVAEPAHGTISIQGEVLYNGVPDTRQLWQVDDAPDYGSSELALRPTMEINGVDVYYGDIPDPEQHVHAGPPQPEGWEESDEQFSPPSSLV
ncbi:hypothetical protein LTS10_013000 [Elasticomyces elasticus]|nr:hypothetical protein LTS10_013000 [Elasticomyces elasticus]